MECKCSFTNDRKQKKIITEAPTIIHHKKQCFPEVYQMFWLLGTLQGRLAKFEYALNMDCQYQFS